MNLSSLDSEQIMMETDEIVREVRKKGFLLLGAETAQEMLNKIHVGDFGRLLPQDKYGITVYDVRPDAAAENTASSKGTLPIEPHTDGALTDEPPALIALYGKHVPLFEQCQTHICNAADVYDGLTSGQRVVLKIPDPNKGVFKYTFQNAVYNDYWISEEDLLLAKAALTDAQKAAIEAMTLAFLRYKVSVTIREGDLLIIDNRKSLHSRDSVLTANRHLLRYWISEI
jgi:alpha-ketoglutarate-dependent taurine dioxygenase